MIHELPARSPEAFVVASTGRRVVGWRMDDAFEIALPDDVEVRDAEFEVDAFEPSGAPAFDEVVVDRPDGTRVKERRRARAKEVRRERVVVSHGGTVAGREGDLLVRDEERGSGWHALPGRAAVETALVDAQKAKE